MRLIDIKRSINIAYENRNFKYISISGGILQFTNVDILRIAIGELVKIGFLPNEDPYDFFLATYADKINVDPNKHPQIEFKIKLLTSSIEMLYQWINNYVTTEETAETINIKLPQIHNIEDIIESCKLINKSLSQSVAEIGGTLGFKQLDYGSSWIIISVGTTMAAGLVMSIAQAAYFVAKKYYAIKLMAKQYERYAMGNEIMKTIKETNDKILKEEIDAQARQLESKYYPESDNERLGRLRVSINEMYKLIELGGEVHPSLILKNDAKDADIDYKQLLNFNKEMGLLPKEKTSDNDKQPQ